MADKPTPSIRRILVIRTDRIGDVLLSTPVLSALREVYPAAFLAILVRPYTLDVVEGHPALDLALIDDADRQHRGIRGLLRLAGQIRAHRFEVVIVLHPTLRLALLCLLAGIPIRVGTGYRAYSMLFNRRVYEHRRDARRHEVEYNMGLLSALGVTAPPSNPHITVTDTARRSIAARCDGWGIRPHEALVVLHPGSGGSARSWPPSYFAALGDRLGDTPGIRVILTGGPDEGELVRSVARQMHTEPITLVDETTIKELAALLEISRLCVTNSTGPLHMAAAVGTPTVALYCPIIPCSPSRWGPYGEGHRVLQPDVPACPRCIGTACEYFDCMTLVSVDSVSRAAQEILQLVNSRQ